MRITGGRAKGIQLRVYKGEVRPSTDCLREKIFSKIAKYVENAVVLDLFAGTGAYGLESLSRGASFVYFVEKNSKAILPLNDNINNVCKSANIAKEDSAIVVNTNAFKLITEKMPGISLIFIDPPYKMWTEDKTNVNNLLKILKEVYPAAIQIVEKPVEIAIDDYINEIPGKKGGPAVFIYNPIAK